MICLILFTKSKISPKGKINIADLKKIGLNAIVFSAPALVVFFSQLSMGVEPKAALLVALLIFWGLLADFFKKLKNI